MWRFLFLLVLGCGACSKSMEDPVVTSNSLFSRLSAEETGIHFINQLELKEDFDVFRYRNYYNGGGVGFGDFNNDGLVDVYLTSNMDENKLFLNLGNWKFQDITTKAGVKGNKIWSTGVSVADINGDGLLDIYVCNAGDVKGGKRENELFINNGDLTFTDKAEEYGIADKGFSTHAVFFDYDKDGDLDCYILNNSYRPVSTLGYRNLRNERDEFGGHKLYRNDNDHFVDVSEHAGIFGSVIGFGLGVTVGDVNQDYWPDLYISNDFYERDYLYINNQDGTFKEVIEDYMGHLSMFSMGADLADMDNDGYPEIFTTDMLPKDPYRLKTLTAFETYDVYQLRLRNGYYHQFMRNMLHKNNRDGSFSEVGAMAGVDATDWSWGALMTDFNNDRYKDIFVSNGIYKDLINQDFLEYLGNNEQMKAVTEGKKVNFKEFTDNMPSTKLSNMVFSRTSDWRYADVANEWGLGEPSFSNGAAYADIDNDGDLDLIVNNVNQELFVYKNESNEKLNNHSLSLDFKGVGKNTFALGASVKAYVKEEIIYMDHMPIRGFQSSMGYRMIIGLGDQLSIDSLVITWPDEKQLRLKEMKADQLLTLNYQDATPPSSNSKPKKEETLLTQLADSSVFHIENDFNDFDRDRLLYHMLSTQGPAFAKADLNGDGLDDFYLGGSVTSKGKIYLQLANGRFQIAQTIEKDEIASDDVDAVFFDADGDHDLDLYVVTGGSENTIQSSSLQDYFFENKGIKNGKPEFVKTENRIPRFYQSGSCVRPIDIDKDGDLDLFVGTRVIPSNYGLPCDQFILLNDGKGYFTDASSTFAPGFKNLGMVTDAAWFDYDGNGFDDLIVVGEWMPITIFLNDGKQLTRKPITGLENTEGWWNTIAADDIDDDGDIDFVLGNLGLNSKFRPTPDSVISLYVNDFDRNGFLEPIFAFKNGDQEYTMALRQDIVKQMTSFKKKFIFYKDYASQSLRDIFDSELLENATKLTFKEPHSSMLINNGASGFHLAPLPIDAQVSPVYGIFISDLNGDGKKDIVLGGNLFSVKPEVGRYDALHGLVLIGDGKNNFKSLSSNQSGLKLKGEVRYICLIKTKKGQQLAFVRNNDSMTFFKVKK